MDFITYCDAGFKCELPIDMKVKSKYPEFVAHNKNRKIYRDIIVAKVETHLVKNFKSIALRWLGESDFMGQKVTLYRRGKFEGKWPGEELIMEKFMHNSAELFYSWRVYITIKYTVLDVHIRGEGDIKLYEHTWQRILDSIELY